MFSYTPLALFSHILLVRYWFVRNSWGEYWGEGGWFRIKRGENQLLLESNCAWAVPGSWTELHPRDHGRPSPYGPQAAGGLGGYGAPGGPPHPHHDGPHGENASFVLTPVSVGIVL